MRTMVAAGYFRMSSPLIIPVPAPISRIRGSCRGDSAAQAAAP